MIIIIMSINKILSYFFHNHYYDNHNDNHNIIIVTMFSHSIITIMVIMSIV